MNNNNKGCEPQKQSKQDTHPEDWLIKKYPTIKYLTIEYYRDKNILIGSIKKLRQLIGSVNC